MNTPQLPDSLFPSSYNVCLMKRFILVFLLFLCSYHFSFAQTANEYFNRGVDASQNGQYEEAISLFTKAIELNPNFAWAYFNRGNAKGYLSRHQEAIEDYDKGLQLNPNDANAYYARGASKGYLDRSQEAIRDFDKAIQLNPNHAIAYGARGLVKHSLGQQQEALKDYKRSLELDPGNAYYQENYDLLLTQISSSSPPPSTPFGTRPNSSSSELVFGDRRDDISPSSSSNSSTASNSSRTPQTHIVSVGIASYESPMMTPLRAPAEQAYQLALLSQTSRFVNQEVEPLTNSKATRSSILSAIRKRLCDPNAVGPNDLVIFYYSGHGTAIGRQIGLCPYDYFDQSQLISDQEIIRLMESSPARHKVCIIEACKSEIIPMSMRAPLSSADIQSFHQSRQSISGGLVFITSTEVGKPSIEFPKKGGIFSHYFLRGIKGEADQNANKQITSQELFDYIKTNVIRDTGGQQIPQINAEGYRLDVPIIRLK